MNSRPAYNVPNFMTLVTVINAWQRLPALKYGPNAAKLQECIRNINLYNDDRGAKSAAIH